MLTWRLLLCAHFWHMFHKDEGVRYVCVFVSVCVFVCVGGCPLISAKVSSVGWVKNFSYNKQKC